KIKNLFYMKLKLLTLFLFITWSAFSQQTGQSLIVSGQVMTAESAEPLPGVNVIINGTSLGTSTDFDGNFRLENIPAGSVLVFTYIGFLTKEITATNSNPLKVYLTEDTQSLDE